MEEPLEQRQRETLPRSPVPSYEAWPSVPKGKIDARVQSDRSNAMDLDNMMSPRDRHSRATSALSMDDIEAAQALEGLRTDFVQSPTRSATLLPDKIDIMQRTSSESSQPEPLLSLITSQHPLLSTAINGSLSAYSSSKSYSPRFRYGAEFVERNIASPVANTVGTAGRISGVETGVRWWLQRSDSNGVPEGSNKRRRINDDHEREDVEKGLQDVTLQTLRHRASSSVSYGETLPAYDDQRSPSYEEHGPMLQTQRSQHDTSSPNSRTWQTRLMMSTSGLGVAMSEESLRSLKYCLTWLKWANSHLGRVLVSLQSVLEEWERSKNPQPTEDSTVINGNDAHTATVASPARDEATITRHIQALKGECLQTLKNVVDIVSKYAGGALPENARILVRRHLTSLPQRFRVASTSNPAANGASEKQAGSSDVVSGAQRVVVLAKEGLIMMAQVSDVVNGTIVSAEEWCDRLGKRREREEQSNGFPNGTVEKKALAQREADAQLSGHDDKRG